MTGSRRAMTGLLAFSISFLAPHNASAANARMMTAIQVRRTPTGVAVDMVFDHRVTARELKPSFDRNFVQIVLRSTRLDSARMIPVDDGNIQKVFAYAYNPDTARVRIILKTDNRWARGRISLWNNNARSIRVFFKERPPETQISGLNKSNAAAAKPAAPIEAPAAPKANAPSTPATAPPSAGPSDSELLKEVIANTKEIDINNPDSVKSAVTAPPEAHPDVQEAKTTVGIRSEPARHFYRMAGALIAVLGLFLGMAMLVKRYGSRLKKLPFGRKERLIQVVATHYLGSKKSISLVKITGEYMVVGVSNEGIALISKLGAEVDVDKYLEDRFWGGTFEKHLGTYAKKEESAGREAKRNYDGARDTDPAPPQPQVADRVELSPLRASIKEKLTKLKPLA